MCVLDHCSVERKDRWDEEPDILLVSKSVMGDTNAHVGIFARDNYKPDTSITFSGRQSTGYTSCLCGRRETNTG